MLVGGGGGRRRQTNKQTPALLCLTDDTVEMSAAGGAQLQAPSGASSRVTSHKSPFVAVVVVVVFGSADSQRPATDQSPAQSEAGGLLAGGK